MFRLFLLIFRWVILILISTLIISFRGILLWRILQFFRFILLHLYSAAAVLNFILFLIYFALICINDFSILTSFKFRLLRVICIQLKVIIFELIVALICIISNICLIYFIQSLSLFQLNTKACQYHIFILWTILIFIFYTIFLKW